MCTAEVTFVDLNTGSTTVLRNVSIAYNEITFTTQHLINHHSYNVTVIATNIAGPNTSHTSFMLTEFPITATTSEFPTTEFPATNKTGKIIHSLDSV